MSPIPDVSVVIVNWNTRDMTLACLASLHAETRETMFETILVDNGSADGSVEVIAGAWPQVRLMAENTNHGFAKANNLAAERARGRYLLLLNSDTLVLNGAIDRLMDFARQRPDARIWGGRTVFGDGALNPGSAWGGLSLWSSASFALGMVKLFPDSALFNPEGLGGWRRDSERRVDIVSGCFFLIETALWRELDGFDPAFFMYGEEADLCARARTLGARPAVTPASTIVHYGGASTSHAPNKQVYLMGAKIGLARRHLTGIAARWTPRMLLSAVAIRSALYGLAATMRPSYTDAARMWRETWRRRAEWRNGPLQGAIV
jgi:GT2 family glycosyltransferase